eukprot:5291323-Pleurochrysis_carterae.AAC.1
MNCTCVAAHAANADQCVSRTGKPCTGVASPTLCADLNMAFTVLLRMRSHRRASPQRSVTPSAQAVCAHEYAWSATVVVR